MSVLLSRNRLLRNRLSLAAARYCTHMVSEEINGTVELLLADLLRFQDRQFLKDPIKAKARRRYVCGLREVTKHLKLKRLKCVIIPAQSGEDSIHRSAVGIANG